MSKKYHQNHRTVYANGEDWFSIQKAAGDEGRSVSNYLVNLHKTNLFNQGKAWIDDIPPQVEIDEKGDIVPVVVKIEDAAGTKFVRGEIPKSDPVQKAADDLADRGISTAGNEQNVTKSKKEPKRTKHGNCVDCGALNGHRAGCME